jgi:hypothetical protein
MGNSWERHLHQVGSIVKDIFYFNKTEITLGEAILHQWEFFGRDIYIKLDLLLFFKRYIQGVSIIDGVERETQIKSEKRFIVV